MATITKYIDVEIDTDEILEDSSDKELIDILNHRGYLITSNGEMNEIEEMITEIYHLKRTGNNFEENLNNLIYKVIGRI